VSAPIRSAVHAPQARILGVGGYRPARVVTNAEICERIDSTDEWIRERSGIRTRHFAAPDETVVDMAVAAVGKAVAHAGIAPEDIGCVAMATITQPVRTPSAAAEVAYRIGATNAAAFDVSAACAGFCYGVSLANDMIRSGSARYVIVIGAEKLTTITDFTDRTTAFIFGDGAGAVVLGPSDTPGVGPTEWGADGSQLQAINMGHSRTDPREDDTMGRLVLQMQGQTVFRWAVWKMAPVASRALALAGVGVDDLDAFIPHQANMRIIDALVKAMKLPAHVAVARDIADTGNTSAASIPLAMDRMLASGEAKSGGTALLIGFGAGLVHAAQVVTLP
jgi:3-oxoacyl-[acyl-carrier-protein] synthase-3